LWTGFWHEMAAELATSDPVYAGMKPREIFEKFVQGAIPMQREQSPEDIGNLVAFLSSEEARNISGQTICVDGGAAMG
jgi:meso-butanediol dehydrogenase/(S,S)-butanediol dehydrogenase/diacetyl reductase